MFQPRESSAVVAGALTRDQLLANLAHDIEIKLPDQFDMETIQVYILSTSHLLTKGISFHLQTC